MPTKGQTPKQVVHTEMSKFKHGKLHSGSKRGPVVKKRSQALAIALSESGQAKPRPPINAHGYKAERRSGQLPSSGHRGAHRIGHRK